MTLGELVADIPATTDNYDDRTIDISDLTGKPAGTDVLTYRMPDVPRMFLRHEDAAAMKRANPSWPLSLAQAVALMAVAHVAPKPGPGEEPVGIQYGKLTTNRAFWSALELRFMAIFPELFSNKDVVGETKNDSGQTVDDTDTSSSASNTSTDIPGNAPA